MPAAGGHLFPVELPWQHQYTHSGNLAVKPHSVIAGYIKQNLNMVGRRIYSDRLTQTSRRFLRVTTCREETEEQWGSRWPLPSWRLSLRFSEISMLAVTWSEDTAEDQRTKLGRSGSGVAAPPVYDWFCWERSSEVWFYLNYLWWVFTDTNGPKMSTLTCKYRSFMDLTRYQFSYYHLWL